MRVDEPPEAVCGTVTVPVDSDNPALGTMPIAFDMPPRIDQANPPAGTLVVPNPVGDGLSASFALQGFWAIEHFLSVHDHWDTLYVDDRGTGRSQPVSCPALQDFEGSRPELAEAVAQCGHSLDPLASRLGAAYVAEDLNRIRTALDLGKIDLYGVWAAAITLDAYAVRYPHSLRSLTYEAPNVPNYRTDPWQRRLPGRLTASADATCASDPMCLESGLDSAAAITRLVSSVARRPVTGTGYDDAGNSFPVNVDEEGLIRILQDSWGYINQGEAGAAALAWLNHRDPVPLARMDAISDASYPRTPILQAPPEVVNFGDTFARICSDYALPFNRFSSSVSQRRQQYEAAAKALPPDTFGPFSVSTWLKVADNTQYCVGWPAPESWRAPVPAASHFPDVPMLSVASNAGTFTGPDLAGPFVRQYPRGKLVIQLMGDAGPINQCGDTFMEQWLVGLDDADLSCNDRGACDATGTFAEKVAQQNPIARPIESSGDQSTRRDRQIAVIAISALRDYLLHDQRPLVEEGPGLRGGSWRFTGSTETTWDVAYDQYRWTDDLNFSGAGHFAVVPSGTSSIPDLFSGRSTSGLPTTTDASERCIW
jgi:hypothetical protein